MRPHGSYIEPFGGSLAVLLNKPGVPVEVVNDIYGLLVLFYKVLREQPDELVRLLMLTPYARGEFNEAKEDAPNLSEVEMARRFFIRINQAFVSSNGGGSWTVTTHSSAGHSNASKWARFQSRLYAVAERLASVQIENVDAMTLLGKMKKPDKGCVVYCDPPYLSMTRNGSKYLHDLSTLEEHEALAGELHRLSGLGHQILLSGYASEHYDEWFKQWDRYVMSTTRNSRSGSGSTAQEEVLWVSVPHTTRRIVRRSGTSSVPG